MDRFVVCGAYDDGNGMCDIIADTVTGDAVLCSDLLGNCYISEVTVVDALPCGEHDAMRKILDYFQCQGVIMSQRNLITLNDGKAYYRNYADNSKIEHTAEYNTDIVCDKDFSGEIDQY